MVLTWFEKISYEVVTTFKAFKLMLSIFYFYHSSNHRKTSDLDMLNHIRVAGFVVNRKIIDRIGDPVHRRLIEMYYVIAFLDCLRYLVIIFTPNEAINFGDYGAFFGKSRIPIILSLMSLRFGLFTMVNRLLLSNKYSHKYRWVTLHLDEELYRTEFAGAYEDEWQRLRHGVNLAHKVNYVCLLCGGLGVALLMSFSVAFMFDSSVHSLPAVIAATLFNNIAMIAIFTQGYVYELLYTFYAVIVYHRLKVARKRVKNLRNSKSIDSMTMSKVLQQYFHLYCEVEDSNFIIKTSLGIALIGSWSSLLDSYYVCFLSNSGQAAKIAFSILEINAIFLSVGNWFTLGSMIRYQDAKVISVWYSIMASSHVSSKNRLLISDLLAMAEARPLGFRCFEAILMSSSTYAMAIQELGGQLMLIASTFPPGSR